jgi:hypothetical protein
VRIGLALTGTRRVRNFSRNSAPHSRGKRACCSCAMCPRPKCELRPHVYHVPGDAYRHPR